MGSAVRVERGEEVNLLPESAFFLRCLTVSGRNVEVLELDVEDYEAVCVGEAVRNDDADALSRAGGGRKHDELISRVSEILSFELPDKDGLVILFRQQTGLTDLGHGREAGISEERALLLGQGNEQADGCQDYQRKERREPDKELQPLVL